MYRYNCWLAREELREARVGPRSCGDRVTIWDDDDDEAVEGRVSEPLVAGPLVQPFEGIEQRIEQRVEQRVELGQVFDRVRGSGMEAPLRRHWGGRRDNREVDDGWT